MMTKPPPVAKTLDETNQIIARLWARIAKLETRTGKLQAQIGQNSTNSSPPAWWDPCVRSGNERRQRSRVRAGRAVSPAISRVTRSADQDSYNTLFAQLPASPLPAEYTRSRLACCGVSVSLHTPSSGVRRGYRHKPLMTTGIRVSSDPQNACQDFQIRNPAIFLAFLRSPTLDILDKFRQCLKWPSTALPEILADRPSRLAFPLAL
jgi:hypothetical protein